MVDIGGVVVDGGVGSELRSMFALVGAEALGLVKNGIKVMMPILKSSLKS